jgi:gluconate kinase
LSRAVQLLFAIDEEVTMRWLRIGFVVMTAAVSGFGCRAERSHEATLPTAPTGVSPVLTVPVVGNGGRVAFPPRNEPFDFRSSLERKYRDQLRRPPTSSFVDVEGDVVWTQEYIRYRVNRCSHSLAVQYVLAQIDGAGIAPVCGDEPAGSIAFPPRNEPFAFRQELERKYRDDLRRPPSATFVDLEGAIVWGQEYLRYRINGCGHVAAEEKVFAQIDGGGIPPTCVEEDDMSGVWHGTSTYFNAPFVMDLSQRGTRVFGSYRDQYDRGSVEGTLIGRDLTLDVRFADTGTRFIGTRDSANLVRGQIRGGPIGGPYPFEMTR